MDTTTIIAIVFAVLAVIFTVVYLLLVRRGANSLRDLSGSMSSRPRKDRTS